MIRIFAALALTLTLASPAARAAEGVVAAPTPEPTPISLGFDILTHWRLDRGHQLFSDSRSAGAVGLTVSYDVAAFAGGTFALAAGWQHENDSRRWASLTPDKTVAGAPAPNAGVVQGERSELNLDTLAVSAIFRWSVQPWLEPLVRLAADATWGKATLQFPGPVTFDGHAFSPGASAGAGLRLRTSTTRIGLPGHPLVAAAATVEGGFHLGSPLTFDLRPPPPRNEKEAADQIPIAGAHIGSLGQSEPYLRVTLAIVF
jgi:hypothetical protein